MKKLRALLRELKKQWLYRVIAALLAGLIFCLFTFKTMGTSAVTYLSLNYPQALQGQYLNGTRLNMYDILSDDILSRAIHKAGLDGRLSTARLSDMITISPRHSSDPVNQYMATEFEVDLAMDGPIDGVDSRGLLQMVCMAFVETFYGSHFYNQTLLEFSLDDMDDLDYNEIGVMFKTKTDLMRDYVDYRYTSDSDFISGETGESFSSLMRKVDDFSSVVLEKYDAYILDNGISKDREKLQSSLDYEQMLLWKDYNSTMLRYDVRIAAIEAYDTIQSAVVMIPTIDTSGDFYMSKTRIGIDYLAEQANISMNQAKLVKRRIDNNDARLALAQSASSTTGRAKLVRAERMIEEIKASLGELEQLIVKTDDDYIREQTAKSLVYRMRPTTDRDLYEFKETAIVVVAAYLLLTALNWLMSKRAPKKKVGWERA